MSPNIVNSSFQRELNPSGGVPTRHSFTTKPIPRWYYLGEGGELRLCYIISKIFGGKYQCFVGLYPAPVLVVHKNWIVSLLHTIVQVMQKAHDVLPPQSSRDITCDDVGNLGEDIINKPSLLVNYPPIWFSDQLGISCLISRSFTLLNEPFCHGLASRSWWSSPTWWWLRLCVLFFNSSGICFPRPSLVATLVYLGLKFLTKANPN